jgi:prepilin-type N-terminal cleavage/methylation domain-containing protein
VKKENLQGFTLIELSIVLVIIGLIVGGVLVGQDLIKAAEVRAQISQIEKYNTAVNTFYSKYQAIPGDMNVATADQFGFTIGSGCTGQTGGRDGNGLIDGIQGGIGSFIDETALFWQDLTTPGLTSLIEGSFTNGGAPPAGCANLSPLPTSTTVGEYFPAGKIGRGTYVIVGESSGTNYYILQGVVGTSGSVVGLHGAWNGATTPIPVLEAYKIDQKVDDGLPTSGVVQAMYTTGTINPTIYQGAPNNTTDGATTCYNTTSNTYSIGFQGGVGANCALSFQMQGAAR